VHALPPTGIRFDSLPGFNVELGGTDGNWTSNLNSYGINHSICIRKTFADNEPGLSKLAKFLFAKQLQKIFNTEGIQAIAISVHPGGYQNR
jgi:hypothetical protein